MNDSNKTRNVPKRFVHVTYDNQSWIRLYEDDSTYTSYRPPELLKLLNGLIEEKERWRESWLEEMQDQQEQSKTLVKLMKENKELKDLLEESQETIIYEYSTRIQEDMAALREVFSDGSLEDIKKFVRGDEND